ncbi:TVP38/TMEM64 family protein [Domibacillus aminovorans]|uniref:TVP38/TMEM64 family membrane protein n=1 Tax=Domibacillus aminovorans TaxID=29332 RepID=A0A177L686_9BACI|nr:VTT domain-containing protein [Domibacillus aminovorans]OAH61260.1 hypothetical protein AWH49_13820 [Domibacillus aminovorans]
MNSVELWIARVIEQAGWIAPILFILLHLLRPILFVPVVVVCIAGGYLFGFVNGTFYSIIGLSLMSAAFYKVVNFFPSVREKMLTLKRKMLKDQKVTVGQVMILRMMPFIHFHLLSLYLIDMTKSYKEYMYYSVLGIIIPSMVYTAFGQSITDMPWYMSLLFLACLIGLYSLLGKLNEKRKLKTR